MNKFCAHFSKHTLYQGNTLTHHWWWMVGYGGKNRRLTHPTKQKGITMHHVVKYVLPMSLAMTLLGCSNVFGQRGVIHDHATDYQGSVDVAPLVIPAHLSGSKMGDDYVVPKARNRGATKPPSLLPPESLP